MAFFGQQHVDGAAVGVRELDQARLERDLGQDTVLWSGRVFGQVELEVVDQRRSGEESPPQVVLGPARPGQGSVGHRPGQSRGQSGAHGGDPWVLSTAGGDLVSWACYVKLVVYLLIGKGLSKGHSTTSPEKNARGWCHALGDLALLIGAGPSHQAPDVIVNPASE